MHIILHCMDRSKGSYRTVVLLTDFLSKKTICLFNMCVDKALNFKKVY